MHLETHALKHNLRAGRERDLFQESRHLRTIECRRRKEYVKLDWEKPERCDIILTSLLCKVRRARHDKNRNTHKLHYPSDRPLHIDPVITIYGNQAG